MTTYDTAAAVAEEKQLGRNYAEKRLRLFTPGVHTMFVSSIVDENGSIWLSIMIRHNVTKEALLPMAMLRQSEPGSATFVTTSIYPIEEHQSKWPRWADQHQRHHFMVGMGNRLAEWFTDLLSSDNNPFA